MAIDTAQQLEKLALRIQALTAMCENIDSRHSAALHYNLRNPSLFYPGLFHQKQPNIDDYIRELNENMAKLMQKLMQSSQGKPNLAEVDENSVEAILLAKVSHQFRALHTCLQLCNVHHQTSNAQVKSIDNSKNNAENKLKKLLNKSHYLYQKLAQQQEYERRLQVMIAQQTDPERIKQTKQRLSRCKAETLKVSLQLQRYEQKKDLS